MTGARDEDILGTCMQEERILITLDLDFADIRNCPPGETPGILVIRMNKQDKRTIIDTVARLLKVITKEQVADKLWIV
jgi:predicted nuclease of predicted toxin-antitoxin system